MSWRLRVPFRSRRVRVTLGTNHEGWTEERARVELERIMGQIERGTWNPPRRERAPVEPEAETIHVTASRWWQRRKGELRPKTREDYRWRLDYILAHLAEVETAAMDVRRVDEFRSWLTEQVSEHTGRPLSPRAVNMVLGLLAQILDDAVEYGLLDQNPARGRRRKVRERHARRTFLEPDQVVDLLEVAGEWEAQLPPHQRFGRRALLATLCLAGLRIGEALDVRLGDLDIHGGRLRIPDAKTPSGERDVEITEFLLDELRSHLAHLTSRHEVSPGLRLFPSGSGRRHNPSNVRRMLRRAVALTNERRSDQQALAEGVTPHSLRRTFVSLALTAGRDPRWVMAQIGHSDARLTLSIYAQVIQRKRVDMATVERLMRFPGEELNRPTNRPTTPREASDASDTI